MSWTYCASPFFVHSAFQQKTIWSIILIEKCPEHSFSCLCGKKSNKYLGPLFVLTRQLSATSHVFESNLSIESSSQHIIHIQLNVWQYWKKKLSEKLEMKKKTPTDCFDSICMELLLECRTQNGVSLVLLVITEALGLLLEAKGKANKQS